MLFIELQEYERSVYPGRIEAENIASEYIDSIISDLDNGNCQIFIAFYEGKSVGYVYGHEFERMDEIIDKDRTYYIEDLVVSRDARGKGIGRQLLDYVALYAKEQGFKQFGLGVLARNTEARKFYRAYGFTEYGIEYIKSI